MRYLVKITESFSFFGSNISEFTLESNDELKELILILPSNTEIISITTLPKIDTFADYKAELLKKEEHELELGKIRRKISRT